MLIKNNKKFRSAGLALLLAVSLFACSDEKHLRDLSTYIANLKKVVTKHQRKDILADIHFPVPVQFQMVKQRDPFEDEQTVTVGASSANPLTSFPVTALEYIGTIVRGRQVIAIIQTPDGKIYQATINNRFGNHYGKIIAIAPE